MRTSTLLLACLLGCSEPAANDTPLDATFPDRCPVTACAVGPTVTSVSELVAIIEATPEWTTLGPYTSGCLTASADIDIPGSLTVQGAEITLPTVCERGACREVVQFRVQGTPPGVECLEPEPWYEFTSCNGLALRDTTIRLRMVREDIHPAEYNFAAFVDVLPACATPCGADELTCAESHTCWPTVRDHCAYCLGASNAACGCWDGSRFAADGAECSIATSGDLIERGTCRAGVCDLGR